jgi:activator of Hsp90 ATPase-like protein
MAGGGGQTACSLWDPPAELAFQWRLASFGPEQTTEVHVRFEAVGPETRVVVEHSGWDTIAPKHAARHGFPLDAFPQREAEWWQILLRACSRWLEGTAQGGSRRYQSVAPARGDRM